MLRSAASQTSEETDRRKSAAGALLRWIEDEITAAPEEHVRSLSDDITVAVCRSALEKTGKSGEKMAASVLCSIDGKRLDFLHMAALQRPSDAEGRKTASQYSVKVSKLLMLENQLIDADIIQYTVPVELGRTMSQSRLDRMNSAKYVLDLLYEMRHG